MPAAEGDGAYGRARAELLYAFGASDYYLCVSKLRPDLLSELDLTQTELTLDEPNYISALRGGKIDAAFPAGGGLFYSEESVVFQSSPIVSAAAELVHRGEYTEETIQTFAVNENNRMQYYFAQTYFPASHTKNPMKRRQDLRGIFRRGKAE